MIKKDEIMEKYEIEKERLKKDFDRKKEKALKKINKEKAVVLADFWLNYISKMFKLN